MVSVADWAETVAPPPPAFGPKMAVYARSGGVVKSMYRPAGAEMRVQVLWASRVETIAKVDVILRGACTSVLPGCFFSSSSDSGTKSWLLLVNWRHGDRCRYFQGTCPRSFCGRTSTPRYSVPYLSRGGSNLTKLRPVFHVFPIPASSKDPADNCCLYGVPDFYTRT